MTKNLKIKIKNTQLAKALELNKLKKEKATLPKKPSEKKKTTRVAKTTAEKKKVVTTPLPSRKKTPVSPAKKEKEKEEKKKKIAVKKEVPAIPPQKEKKTLPLKEKKAEVKPKPLETQPKKKIEWEEPKEGKKGFRAEFGRPTKELKIRQAEETRRTTFDARDRQGLRVEEEPVWRRRKSRFKPTIQKTIEVIRPKTLSVRLPISIKELAHSMKLKASELIAKLLLQGITVTINDYLEDETTVQLLGHDFGCDITIDTSEEARLKITEQTIQEEISHTPPEELKKRAPVIVFMGHVDHGKTSLIDAIRKSNLVGGEAGAITQHIGAFKCHRPNGDIVILDTPGHEAFTLMRQRGVTLADIAILVVAGDEGIMPQTDEAIKQANESNVPIIVAINKCDKPNFNADHVYRQLADRNLLPEAWGGAIITVNCSATTQEGIPDLLEMILLQAELLELKANPNTRARGTVLESALHKGFGVVATILIQNGTLKIGDALVFDQTYARIKTMHDEHGKLLQIAEPATPVKITGLSDRPEIGGEFITVKNEKEARKLCEERASGEKRSIYQRTSKEKLETLMQKQKELSEKKVLKFILRADMQGSVEAIKNSILNIPTKKVDVQFISKGIGEITETDIELAKTSNAVIIGFHTKIESHAEELIKRYYTTIINRDIIYQIIDDVKTLMVNILDKIRQEKEIGSALVKQTFRIPQLGIIAGCQVEEGIIKRNQFAKVYRDKQIIFEGNIASLKRVKEDVKEAGKGTECGILLERFNDVQVGDQIKTFEVTFIPQEL